MSAGAIDFRLDGKTAVVVGATGGIGAATAMACAEAGAAVVLLGRSSEALTLVAERVGESSAKVTVLPCDVTSTASITQAFAALERIDVVVNSAGINHPEPFISVGEETFDRLFAVNVRGAFFVAQAAVRKFVADQADGTIVMISSQMGHVGAPLRTVYCATKHALEGLTKALAIEAAPHGIRVVSIAPTFVRTNMTAAQLDDPVVGRELLAKIPRQRFGTPREVAAAVVFAASPAAAMLTGSSLIIDGGWIAQ